MNCKTCGSTKLASVDAKCGDLIIITLADNTTINAPIDPIGTGDYIRFTFCQECNKIQ